MNIERKDTGDDVHRRSGSGKVCADRLHAVQSMLFGPPGALPELTPENREYWTAGAAGQLRICRCNRCGYFIHPPLPTCRECLSGEVAPVAVTGRGHVASFTLNYQPWTPGMTVPVAIVLVELDEQPGLRLVSIIVNCPLEVVRIRMRVKVIFEQHHDVWLPLFEPEAIS